MQVNESLNPIAQEVDSISAHPRLLFILSDDYGELCNLMYLIKGQPFIENSCILLHSRLFETNSDILPGQTDQWQVLDDIITVIEAFNPDIVFLLTGYLFSGNDLLTFNEVEALVHLLCTRNCRVVTDDPFFGTTASITEDMLDPLYENSTLSADMINRKEIRMAQTYGASMLHRSHDLLRNFIHLYTYPSSHLTLDQNNKTHSITFFNQHLIEISTSADWPIAPNKLNWLFILSNAEYKLQTQLYGEASFIAFLARKIQETLQVDRLPQIIAPAACLELLQQRVPNLERFLISFCNYSRFTSLLLESEYVFYWNILSNSLLLRHVNELPVFFFDKGHMARFIRPLYETAVEHYYQGKPPVYLEWDQSLADPDLIKYVGVSNDSLQKLKVRLGEACSPQDVIQRILEEPLVDSLSLGPFSPPVNRGYLICTTPTAGSLQVCDVLDSTQIFGQPKNVLLQQEHIRYTDLLPRIRVDYKSPNGIYGLKLEWSDLATVLDECKRQPELSYLDAPQILEQYLPNLSYFWLQTENKLQQAIDFVIAQQWVQYSNLSQAPEPQFDYYLIADTYSMIKTQDQNWQDFFSQHDIQVVRLNYEDLIHDDKSVLQTMMRHLDIKEPLPSEIELSLSSTEQSQRWLEQYNQLSTQDPYCTYVSVYDIQKLAAEGKYQDVIGITVQYPQESSFFYKAKMLCFFLKLKVTRDFAGARTQLEAAIAHSPDNPEAYANLALLDIEMGQLEEAAKHVSLAEAKLSDLSINNTAIFNRFNWLENTTLRQTKQVVTQILNRVKPKLAG